MMYLAAIRPPRGRLAIPIDVWRISEAYSAPRRISAGRLTGVLGLSTKDVWIVGT
jgi:hypothetical protein